VRLLVLTLASVVASTSLATDTWRQAGTHDGVAIETRDVEGSSVHELRATSHVPVPPTAVLATLWRHDEYTRFVPYLTRLDVLRDDGDTRLLYEQLHIPIVKDRDVVLRVTRHVDQASGVCDVTTLAVPGEGPPTTDAFVRVQTSAGRWHLEPAADGGTDVTYTIRTDVGGFVPGWIANVAQREAAPKLVRAMLDRAMENTR
jgi:ribosome-associated toxin RatA of RatAB toxin-antitoxin module